MKYLVDSDWIIDATAGMQSAVATLDDLSDDGLTVSAVVNGETERRCVSQ
jgi:hypothetical protein